MELLLQDSCSCPEKYPYIVTMIFLCLAVVYDFFGLFNYLVYGAAHLADPLITSDIPNDTIVIVTEILFIGITLQPLS